MLKPRLRLSALLLPAVLGGPLLILAGGAWVSWTQAVHEARIELTRTADASAEYMRRVLDGHRLRADRANDLLSGLSDAEIRAREAELHGMLRDIVERDYGVGSITLTVFDRNARPLASANVYPLPRNISVADREYVQALQAVAPATFISPVYVGRLDGNVFFTVSQRRTGAGNGLPPGAYDGVINLSVGVDDAGAALRRLRAGPEDMIALVHSNGEVLARSTPIDGAPPLRLQPDSPMLPVMARGDESAFVEGQSTLDGVTRFAAFRRVQGYPVYVSAGRTRQAVAARWREAVATQLAIGTPAMLALAGLGFMVRRRERELDATNRSLEGRVAQRTAELQESERRLATILDQLPAGVIVAEAPSGRILFGNAAVARLFGSDWARSEAAEEYPAQWRPHHPDTGEPYEVGEIPMVRALHGEVVEAEAMCFPPHGGRGWIELLVNAAPLHDDAGAVTGGILAFTDATELRAAEAALRESEARLRLAQEAGGIGSWDWNVETGALHWSETCHRLHGTDPAVRASYDVWRAGISPEDWPAVEAALRAALEGRASGWETEFRFRRVSDGEVRWILGRGSIERDPATGQARRVLGVAIDTTERKRAEERQTLLMRELDHRAKNALAVVQAALRLTPKDDAQVYANAVEGRVAALARAHTLLAAGRWEGAALRQLVQWELAAFSLGGGNADGASVPQVEVHGPDLMLAASAVQALSIALHELATNATKHGALGAPGGRVAVSWQVDQVARRFRLNWVEQGGPAVTTPPSRRGFGSRVIEATVRDQLGGSVERRWMPEGLVCTIEVPLARLEAPVGGGDVPDAAVAGAL